MTGHTSQHDSRALLAVVLICVALGGLVGLAGTAVANHGPTAVTFDDQTANQTDGATTVTVANVTLKNDGYVTIHNESFDGSGMHTASESIIGVSDYLEAGNHTNVTVTLYTDVPGRTFEQEQLTEGATLVAGLYGETNTSSGNTTFNRITHQGRHLETGVRDGPYRTDGEDSVVVHDTANVILPDASDDSNSGSDDGDSDDSDSNSDSDAESDEVTQETAGNASVSYDDQQATDTVTVESATLPDGGFVVVYNASGAVIGNTSVLEAGAHENITVEVSPAFERSGVSYARLYRDNGSEGTFNATTDATYNTSTGSAVSSTAYISVDSNATGTETTETVTDSAETTPDDGEATDSAATTTADEGTATGSPGFTAVLALIALCAAALVAVRRTQ